MTFEEWWHHKGTSSYNQCPRWIEKKISEKVWEAATLAERERCAKVCDSLKSNDYCVDVRVAAEAIRKS